MRKLRLVMVAGAWGLACSVGADRISARAVPGRAGEGVRVARLLAARPEVDPGAGEAKRVTTDLYVAPDGRDAADGSADRPFATLARAVRAARERAGDRPRRILVRGGRYFDAHVELGPEDSGLTIEAAPGARPILYGGVALSGWEKEGDRFWAARLPAGRSWDVRLLQVNGKLCPRARYPAAGRLTHLNTFDVPWMSTTGGGWKRKPTPAELTTLNYREGDLGPWLEVGSAEVTVYHMWDESCVGVVGHDPVRRVLTLTPPCGHPPGAFGVKEYVLWNTRKGMTAPGQWYFDRTGGHIVYWPRQDEEMTRVEAVVPTVATIIALRGTMERPVRDVLLRGLRLEVTTAPLITGGFAAASFDGAISLSRTERCTLSGLTVTQVAGHGINTRGPCVATRVQECEVSQCGAGGIYVGGAGAVIDNNHVHAVGISYPSAIGIFRGGKGNRVSHNEVHDCPYSAINYGGEGNIVEYNLLYDCMRVLHDGAAIYMFAAKGCILRGNVARDILDTGGYGSSAYYLDEQSEGSVVERNLSVNVARPLHNHMAATNTIRDNVFIVSGDARLTFPRCHGFTMDGNVLYATGKIRVDNPAAVEKWSRNLFYSKTGKLEGVALKEYATAGPTPAAGEGTVTADPMFVDLERGDYRYRRGSPALKLGLRRSMRGRPGGFGTGRAGEGAHSAGKRRRCVGEEPVLKLMGPFGAMKRFGLLAVTLCLAQGSEKPCRYPGEIDGKMWDRAALEAALRPVIDFQKSYGVHIYIGEFSAIRWAPDNSAYRYLKDLIDIFEEYGWDWSYHVFREWNGWSVEHGPDRQNNAPAERPTDRQKLPCEWFARNQKPPWDRAPQEHAQAFLRSE